MQTEDNNESKDPREVLTSDMRDVLANMRSKETAQEKQDQPQTKDAMAQSDKEAGNPYGDEESENSEEALTSATDDQENETGQGTEQKTKDAQKDEPTDAEQTASHSDDPANEKSGTDNTNDKPQAPSTWTPKAKADFYDLPDHIQKEIVKRETDFHNGIKEFKDHANYARNIKQVLNPYEPMLRAKGLQPEQVIGEMLNASYRLSQGTPQDKARFILEIAQQSGADLQSLINSGNNTSNSTKAKSPEVQQLEQRLAQMEQFTQSQAQTAKQREFENVQQTIKQFSSAVDNEGKPLRPFFEDVRKDMAQLIDAAEMNGKSLTLDQAYDMAVWARPDIRQTLLERQSRATNEQALNEQKKRAQIARKKASVNVKATNTGKAASPSAPSGDIRDDMRRTLENLRAANS